VESGKEEPEVGQDTLIRRAYSIASSSVEKDYLEFYVTLVASGELTPRLFALKYGARLFLAPKASGLFTLDHVAPGKAVFLIGTGTGLAPYMSMLRTMLVVDTERKFVVVHGARYSWDLGYRAELETLARIRPNLTYIPAITRPEEDVHFRGATGRVQWLLEQGVPQKLSGVPLDPLTTEVFLCGNPEMIAAAKAVLQARGFVAARGKEPGTVHVEEYW
jgi:ferredoxin--NADP+ reductase